MYIQAETDLFVSCHALNLFEFDENDEQTDEKVGKLEFALLIGPSLNQQHKRLFEVEREAVF